MLETIKIQKSKNLQFLPFPRVTTVDLVNFEATVVLLEELISHFRVFIEARKNASKNHFEPVEAKIDELSLAYLESYQRKMQMIIRNWGSRPYEEYIHELDQ